MRAKMIVLLVAGVIMLGLPVNAFKVDADFLLKQSWQAYKARFVTADGRVMDPMMGKMTTSEGQSYAMLRAAWMDDKEAFDKVWTWSRNNLENKKLALCSWKWGHRCDGTWGVLDSENATDADEDMAFALLLGSDKWQRKDLLESARAIISAIWTSSVYEADGKAYLTAGSWAKERSKPRINPSYLAPYIYRLFARVDTAHNWMKVINSSYDVLEQACRLSRIGLPPDWCDLDAATGRVTIDRLSRDSDYSLDAARVPWRIAMDWKWNQDERARRLLERLDFLQDSWKTNRTIRASYTAQGVMRSFDEPLETFGCLLPYFQITAEPMATEVLQERILSRYYDGMWRPEDNYYGQNWAWFGMAALSNKLTLPAI